jgi:hypothetical protein
MPRYALCRQPLILPPLKYFFLNFFVKLPASALSMGALS